MLLLPANLIIILKQSGVFSETLDNDNYFFPKIPYFHEDMELTGYKLGDFLLKRIAGAEINELQHVERNKFIKNDELFNS